MTVLAREWLVRLETTPGAYREMLEAVGDLYMAAHMLARARLETRGYNSPVPSRADLYAALQELHARAGLTMPLPTAAAAASICEAGGLPVV